ncbi:ferredoxin--nitrite reductase [Haloferax mediterranei ATCC 33500]|uniref:Ferredoxin--nitrite reductase n=1 Tax=Haloferax mediterranei (strain ATCC 33500 / DSM 1411 / JCM 8866 / NBRC 14739 / NCIMB 2177 / R-4) TaxID=523841 RepID=I3R5V5_HALMT|nr:ferredoxin--nitrite reductase [Haloferax mediterranei]AFK19615.1 ferredoxin-nitrite reductase [Haloferax mediterranei ATCC 33500]AHZ23006.1 ferredoxin--nitrite reductase [Haloferax mediterranei ATCC 33500]ELZ99933.1 ferredoxin-nitrite reductase [Haloferax mediterranei ATCC 33500]MDX5987644.1 ferredoxin--nitrite reductase [Haloferax mediterranei ATCC 33500]QCQ74130.1 ferredoxin--nitrite reductase [Haloferax mediterranei ATCC 33500]
MPTDVERWKSEVYGNEIREHLFRFAEEGWDAIPEDERDAWFERFKWWGLYHQRNGQESYFMMRIGTPNGVLTPGQTEVVAEVADEYARGPAENPIFGNGYVDWTTRQSIQLHWIKLEDIPELFDKLESVGLSTQQACGDSWRNIVGCPVAGKDKHEHVDALPVAMELNETFKGNDDHSNLPRKWKVSITGCREGCGQGDINDLALEPATKEIDGEETKGFNIRIGGGLSRNEPRLARDIDVFVTPEQAAEVSGAISALFRDNGDRENRYNARIKFLMDEWGAEKFRNVLQEEYVDFELETAGEDLRSEYSYNSGYANGGHADHVGIHEQADGNYYVGLNVLVGRMGVDETKELARVADEYGSGEVRVTQRQNVIITDVPEEKLDALQEEDLLEHYSPDPHPFMRGSIACTGTEFCSLSIVETKNRQVRYARWLKENVELPEGVEDFHIHLSGCTASCAQPQIADVSLRGMKTRKNGDPVEALDIGLGGGLGENPNFAEWVTQRVPVDEVPGAIKNLLANFEERREGDETFREFVARTDEEDLAELVEPEETSYEDPMMHNTKRTWYPYAEDDSLDASPAPTAGDGTPIASDD